MSSFEFTGTENEPSFVDIIDLGVRIARHCDEYETRYKHDSLTGIALTALLARNAQWREAWTELMVAAREIDTFSLTGNMIKTRYTYKLDDIQRRVDAMGVTK